jgi:hypothetical protein
MVRNPKFMTQAKQLWTWVRWQKWLEKVGTSGIQKGTRGQGCVKKPNVGESQGNKQVRRSPHGRREIRTMNSKSSNDWLKSPRRWKSGGWPHRPKCVWRPQLRFPDWPPYKNPIPNQPTPHWFPRNQYILWSGARTDTFCSPTQTQFAFSLKKQWMELMHLVNRSPSDHSDGQENLSRPGIFILLQTNNWRHFLASSIGRPNLSFCIFWNVKGVEKQTFRANPYAVNSYSIFPTYRLFLMANVSILLICRWCS